MSDVTNILDAAQRGEATDAEKLLPLVYGELRKLAAHRMAQEAPGHTLQPTALVHEAWLRLLKPEEQARLENRTHFFGAAAEAMRRILITSARRRAAACHGGGAERVNADDVEITAPAKDDELLAIHETLDALTAHDARKAELVKLRYFAGLPILCRQQQCEKTEPF